MQLPVVTILALTPRDLARQRRRLLGYNVDGKDWVGASEVRAQCEAAGGGREEQKGRKDGAVVKGDQVLLCYTSRLRTSGKSCIQAMISCRIVI